MTERSELVRLSSDVITSCIASRSREDSATSRRRPTPTALVPHIHIHRFKVPATREAISTDELHTDSQRDCDSEQDRQMCDRSIAQSRQKASRIAKSGIHISPVSRAEAVSSHQTAYFESSRKYGSR